MKLVSLVPADVILSVMGIAHWRECDIPLPLRAIKTGNAAYHVEFGLIYLLIVLSINPRSFTYTSQQPATEYPQSSSVVFLFYFLRQGLSIYPWLA